MSASDPASFYDFEHYRLARTRTGDLAEFPTRSSIELRRFLALDARAFQLVMIDLYADKAISRQTEHRVEKFRQTLARTPSASFGRLMRWGRDDGDFFVISGVTEGEPIADYLKRIGPLPQGVAARLVVDLIEELEHTKLASLVRGIDPTMLLISNGRLVFVDYLTEPQTGRKLERSIEWLFDGLVTGDFFPERTAGSTFGSITKIHEELSKIAVKPTTALPPHRRPVREWFLKGTPLVNRNFTRELPWEMRDEKANKIKAEGNAFSLAPSDAVLPHALAPEQHVRSILPKSPLPGAAVPHGSTSRCGNARLIGETFPSGNWRSLGEIVRTGEVTSAKAALAKVSAVIAAVDRLQATSFPVWWVSPESVFFPENGASGSQPLIRPFYSMRMLIDGLPLPEPILDRMQKPTRDRDSDSARRYRRSAVTLGLVNALPSFDRGAVGLSKETSDFLEKLRESPESFPMLEEGELLETLQGMVRTSPASIEPDEVAVSKSKEAKEAKRDKTERKPIQMPRIPWKAAALVALGIGLAGSIGTAFWHFADRVAVGEKTRPEPNLAEFATQTESVATELETAPLATTDPSIPVDFESLAADENHLPHPLEYLFSAAENADPSAMALLAHCYLEGWGVEADPAQALAWFTEAAEAGDPAAHYQLGAFYAAGNDDMGDPEKAVAVFREGAVLGDEACMLVLARALESGFGVKQDIETARAWYEKAASMGNAAAIEWIEAQSATASSG